MPSFIADGYVFHAGIRPLKEVHDGLEFHFRPLTPVESTELSLGLEGLSGEEHCRLKAKKLCEKIQGWRSPPVDGKPGPKIPQLTEDLLVGGDGKNTINTNLLTRIESIVFWGAPPDYTVDESSYQDEVKNSQTASS